MAESSVLSVDGLVEKFLANPQIIGAVVGQVMNDPATWLNFRQQLKNTIADPRVLRDIDSLYSRRQHELALGKLPNISLTPLQILQLFNRTPESEPIAKDAYSAVISAFGGNKKALHEYLGPARGTIYRHLERLGLH